MGAATMPRRASAMTRRVHRAALALETLSHQVAPQTELPKPADKHIRNLRRLFNTSLHCCLQTVCQQICGHESVSLTAPQNAHPPNEIFLLFFTFLFGAKTPYHGHETALKSKT